MKFTLWKSVWAQPGCMRQVLGPGALGRPRGTGWRGRWEGGSGWGIHVNPWLIHVNVWQKPLQYCKVISLQLIKINEKKKRMIQRLHKVVQPSQVYNSLTFSLFQKKSCTHYQSFPFPCSLSPRWPLVYFLSLLTFPHQYLPLSIFLIIPILVGV